MRAAFRAYEEANLTRLRKANPSLRLQQVRNLLWADWQKAAENPMVQARLNELAVSQQQERLEDYPYEGNDDDGDE